MHMQGLLFCMLSDDNIFMENVSWLLLCTLFLRQFQCFIRLFSKINAMSIEYVSVIWENCCGLWKAVCRYIRGGFKSFGIILAWMWDAIKFSHCLLIESKSWMYAVEISWGYAIWNVLRIQKLRLKKYFFLFFCLLVFSAIASFRARLCLYFWRVEFPDQSAGWN